MKGVAYVLMVQRANFKNSDASDVRRAWEGLIVSDESTAFRRLGYHVTDWATTSP